MTLQINTTAGARDLTTDEQAEVRTALGAAAAAELSAHSSSTSNPHSVTKAQVGLGSVDNTADANKPVSTAQAAAIGAAVTAHIDATDPHPGKYAPTDHTHTPASIGAATAAQGAKADAALQPGAQFTQAAVTAATAPGVALLGAATAAAQRTELGLGTAATTAASDYATAAQGAKADAALVASADAIADVLEAAPTTDPAALARIQYSVSGDWLADGRLRSMIAAYASSASSPAMLPVLSVLPTVTPTSTPDATLTRDTRYWTGNNAGLFELDGSHLWQQYATSWLRARGCPLTSGGTQTSESYGSATICTDAPKLQFAIIGHGSLRYRLSVCKPGQKRQYVDPAGHLAAAAGGTTYLTVDFAGVRGLRQITIEFQQDAGIMGIRCLPTDTLVPPNYISKRAEIVTHTDSYGAGTVSDSANANQASIFGSCFASQMTQLLGARQAMSGMGGTGWTNVGVGKLKLSDPIRVAHIAAALPDAIFCFGSTNDRGQTAAAVQAEVASFISQVRAIPALAKRPLVFSLTTGIYNNGTVMQTVESGISAAVDAAVAAGDSRVALIRTIVPTLYPAPITGTGKQGATNGSGNTDFLIGTDGAHFTVPGVNYWTQLMSAHFVAALAAMLQS